MVTVVFDEDCLTVEEKVDSGTEGGGEEILMSHAVVEVDGWQRRYD